MELSETKRQAFYERHIGTNAEVLFEKAAKGKAMHGFTRNYIRVELSPSDSNEMYDNQLTNVRLDNFNIKKTALKAIIL